MTSHLDRARVHMQPWADGFSLHLMQRTPTGRAWATSLVMKTISEGEPFDGDLIILSHDAAQELMDSLWVGGVRPTEGAGTAGAMAQAQAHIVSLKETIEKLNSYIIKLSGVKK